jgi:hypothetical protein
VTGSDNSRSAPLRCSRCGAKVSTPVPLSTVVRAWIECSECVESPRDANELLAIGRCPECRHDLAASRFEICIGCPCESDQHSEMARLQRELDEKYVPLDSGGTDV